jgi:hypothetical protein
LNEERLPVFEVGQAEKGEDVDCVRLEVLTEEQEMAVVGNRQKGKRGQRRSVVGGRKSGTEPTRRNERLVETVRIDRED